MIKEWVLTHNGSTRVNAEDVDVKVENRVVTLSGTVPSWDAYWAANDAAQYTSGVVKVINDISVSCHSAMGMAA